MALRPKNWDKFQHYKNRRPTWIKLHRELLDKEEFYALKGEDAKYLFMIWLIASEEHGELPPMKQLAFRLRLTVSKCEELVSRLGEWLESGPCEVLAEEPKSASNALAGCKQVASPEGEGEKEGEGEGEERASALPPPEPHEPSSPFPDADQDDEAPEGLALVQYRQHVCRRLGIAESYGNQVAMQDGIEAVMRDEAQPAHIATATLIRRARDHPPPDGKWRFWIDDGGWKQREPQGISTEGWE